MEAIKIKQMDEEQFAPFGDIIDFDRKADFQINNGMCDRYHALATIDVTGAERKELSALVWQNPTSCRFNWK